MSQRSSGGGGTEGGGAAGALPEEQPWGFFSNSNKPGCGSEEKGPTPRVQNSSCSILPTSGSSGTVAFFGEKMAPDHGSSGASKGKRPAGSAATPITVGDSDHELHIWTERERRKKMRDMFSSLHSLLPHLPPKADKSTIVDEAVKEIEKLQQKYQDLKKKKQERLQELLPEDHQSNSVTQQLQRPQGGGLDQLFIGTREATLADHVKGWPMAMNSPNCVSISQFPQAFQTWSSPNVVLSVSGEDAHISICAPKKAGFFSTLLYVMEKHKLEVVTATVSSDFLRIMLMIHARANGVSDQFPETLMVEEIYKMAIGEIILWLSSP